MTRTITAIALATATLATGAAAPALATEMGGSSYQHGAEGYLAGALPPPGTYWLNYLMHYSADRFNDGDGNALIPDFDLSASAEVLRLVHVTDMTLLGASYGVQVLVPVVHLSVDAAGASDSSTGLGDILFSPIILGWHDERMHYVFALDIFAPTGAYDATDLANIGRNYWDVEPVFALTYLDPEGLEVSAKFMYDFNFKNGDGAVTPFNPTGAGYRSGQEFHVDFAAGWNFGTWQLGAAGYYYVQTTDDEIDDPVADATLKTVFDGFRGEALALGPSARLETNGIQMIATWQHELFSEYKPEGDKLWFKTILRF